MDPIRGSTPGRLPSLFFALLALAGAACVLCGLWLVYAPLALVLGGCALVYAAYAGDKSWGS